MMMLSTRMHSFVTQKPVIISNLSENYRLSSYKCFKVISFIKYLKKTNVALVGFMWKKQSQIM